MDSNALTALRERLESAATLDDALAGDAAAMLSDGFREPIAPEATKTGLLGSAESAIRVVGHAYPGWALSFDGHASPRDNTKWRCTLRETRGPDDDQIVGIGNANSMRLALLAAVAHIKIMHAAGYG